MLISRLAYAQKYTSGCLSFAEVPEEIGEEKMRTVMDSFEAEHIRRTFKS